MQKINWNNNKLSKLCLGTVQFGLDYGIANESGQVDQGEVDKILNFVISKGINCFDTAKGYGNSEEVIGNYFSEFSKDINAVSKIKSEILKSSAETLKNEILDSLAKIGVKNLFGLLLHDSDALFSWDEGYSSQIKKLKKENLIKYFGVSIYTDEEFEYAINNDDIELIQIPFNIFDQRAISKNWLQRAKESNKLIFIRSVYLQGLILMQKDKIPKHLEEARVYIEKLHDLCNDLNLTRNQLALGFVNTAAKDSVVLFGCDNLEQAEQNIDNFNKLNNIDDSTLEYIKKSFSAISENIYNPTKWKTK